jgi:hypothetical protein
MGTGRGGDPSLHPAACARGPVSDPASRFERPGLIKAPRLCRGIIYSRLCVAGNCPIMGLGSFGTRAFLAESPFEYRNLHFGHMPCCVRDAPARLTNDNKVARRTRSWFRVTAAWPARTVWLPLAPADVDLFSCQRSEARRTARLSEPRAQEVRCNGTFE